MIAQIPLPCDPLLVVVSLDCGEDSNLVDSASSHTMPISKIKPHMFKVKSCMYFEIVKGSLDQF
jgi:hypothetical protein